VRWLTCHPGAHFAVADVHVGWRDALVAAGEHVVDYPLGDALAFYGSVLTQCGPEQFRLALTGQQAAELASDRLAGALYKVRPDILWITSGFFVNPHLLDVARRDGVKVVLLCTEQPYELPRELALAEHCDVTLLNDPTHLDKFRAAGTAEYMRHAYRPALHHPGPAIPELDSDLAFCGTAYPSRVAFFEAMDLDGLDVTLAGNWQGLTDDSPLRRYVAHEIADECLPNERAIDIYRSTRASINLYRREAQADDLIEGWSIGPREVELAATRTFFLRDPRPEGDALFPMLPTFTSPAEAGEVLRWYLDHPAERETAAAKAHEAVADRTFDANAAALLRLLDKE